MITNIVYDEDGSIDIDIDNSELLAQRADISNEVKVQELLDKNEIGGIKGEEERELRNNLKRSGWNEARRATDVKHVCPVCGTKYWGRPNKNYCGTPCKEVAKKRRSRKRMRDIRDFKPHRGTGGEVYFMEKKKDKQIITFVPAFYADKRIRAKGYIDSTYSEEVREEYIKQVNEVIRK